MKIEAALVAWRNELCTRPCSRRSAARFAATTALSSEPEFERQVLVGFGEQLFGLAEATQPDEGQPLHAEGAPGSTLGTVPGPLVVGGPGHTEWA